jgi:O-antigen ligase
MQIPFLLAVAVSPQVNRKIRVIVGAGCVVLLQALFLTGSRGAWVASAASVAIFALVANRRAFVAIALAYSLLPVIAYGFNQTRLESMLRLASGEEQTESDQSVQYRVEVWKNLGKLVEFPYVWGQGYNTAPNALSRLGISEDQTATHSSIISLVVELGLIGLVLYAWIMFGIWKKAFGVLRSPGTVLGHLLAAGFIGAVPALIISDVTGGRFYNGEIMAYFWLLAGVMFRETADASAAHVPTRSLAPALLLPAFKPREPAGARIPTPTVPTSSVRRA